MLLSCQHCRARHWGQKENSTKSNILHWPRHHFSSAEVSESSSINSWGLMAKISMTFLTCLISSPSRCKSGALHCAKPMSGNPGQKHQPPFYAAAPDRGYTIMNTSLFPRANRLQIAKETPKPKNQPTKSKGLSAELFSYSEYFQVFQKNANNLFEQSFFQLKWQAQKNLCSCIFIFFK